MSDVIYAVAGRVRIIVLVVMGLGLSFANAQQVNSTGKVSTPSNATLQPAGSKAPDVPAAPPGPASGNYVLSPSDMVQIRVFQEDDLTSDLRIARDGTIVFPLLGTIKIGGKTINEATAYIRDLLQRDYLVNPQVTINISQYSKRRFAVLGQVANSGYYELPNEETVTLLQAIAMAGGYSRIADPSRITVKRNNSKGETVVIKLNGKAMARDDAAQQFEILPDDIITVGESLF